MRNLGCKDICATTDNHNQTKTRVQVAENVKSTLLSVVEAGNTVSFDSDGSYIYNNILANQSQCTDPTVSTR